ncbi:MAG: hypothetical protein Kapaf2KO_23640 [Candidatus Kapaibacteriales bacterium]
MDKRTFFKAAGVLGTGLMVGKSKAVSSPSQTQSCVLVPSETAGPFPLDLTENDQFFRRDIREGQEGVPHRIKMRIIGDANCGPIPNARVHIWHCGRDGYYSGYDTSSNPGQQSLTYLRGWQMTDSDGMVEFLTSFPGWYNGRITHIHFQVFVSSSFSAVSQFTFPLQPKNEIYSQNSQLYPKGTDPLSFNQDFAFADGYEQQIATLTEAPDISGYESFIEVTVKGEGISSVGYQENQNAKHFILGQNYPNPAIEETKIPLNLLTPSEIKIEVFDFSGKKLFSNDIGFRDVGKHEIEIADMGKYSNSLVYKLTVKNQSGIFTDIKVITLKK